MAHYYNNNLDIKSEYIINLLLMKLLLFILLPFMALMATPFTEELMEENHSVYLTSTPDETHEWKLKLIREANLSIEVSTGYCKGIVVDELLNTIHEKLISNSQIKVHVALTQTFDFITDEQFAFLNTLQSTYPERFKYFSTEMTNILNQEDKAYTTENHTKLIIIDEKYILVGGTNLLDNLSTQDVNKVSAHDILDHILPKGASDMDAIIRGPIAKKIRKEFFDMYALLASNESLEDKNGEFTPLGSTYFPIDTIGRSEIVSFEGNPKTAHQVKVYGVITGPRMQLHTIGNIYEHLINNANVSIDIGHMYFFPRQSIYEGLIEAVNRGAALSVVTNGPHDQFSEANASRSLYGHINRLNYFPTMAGKQFKIWELFEARDTEAKNTDIYELNLESVLYHKKVMAVDHLYSIIGSYNLGMKSEDADFEVAVVIESPKIATDLENILHEDQTHSRKISFLQAMGWYFNPYYNIAESFERKFFDGVIL